MIEIYFSNKFIKSAKILSSKLQIKFVSLIEILRQNPFHSKLHTKNLTGDLSGLFSFRITRDWRVIFKFLSPEKIQLIDIAHRKDIYR